jgi:folate-binding protein YgfZ
MADLDSDYAALRGEAGAVWLPRDVIAVTGPEAESYLQGQLSQDVSALRPGESALSFLLQPQGKVDALVRVVRHAPDRFTIDVDEGFGDAVVARLNRFKLRTKADVEAIEWRCLSIRGPRAHDVAPGGLPFDWPGLPGVDRLGPAPDVPAGVPMCAMDAYEAVRIEAGVPAMGRELTERTIPAETGSHVIDRAVSFTKGCFTGQELVARIDARGGNVPRLLRGVVMDASVRPPAGAVLALDGKQVGELTSVAGPVAGSVVGLAYVARAITPPADAQLRWDATTDSAPDGRPETRARLEVLPLVS